MILLLVLPLLLAQSSETPPPPPRRVAEVLFIAEDSKGRRLTDLAVGEVILNQEGVIQKVDELRLEGGIHRLSYRPTTGTLGRILVSLKRLGTRLRGPDGPGVTVRWKINLDAFEVPLFDMLEAGVAASDLGVSLRTLRFGANDEGIQQAFVVVVPPRLVDGSIPVGVLGSSHLGNASPCERHLMLRVRDAEGREVLRRSQRRLCGASDWAFWSCHGRLAPGLYTLEVVAHDTCAGKSGIHREALDVAPWVDGLRVSEVVPLFQTENAKPTDETPDNPFLVGGQILVPTIADTYYEESMGGRGFFAVLFPDPASPEPVAAAIEIRRDGKLLATRPVALPPAEPSGAIRYVGTLSGAAVPGTYTIRIIARQGTATQERDLSFVTE